MESTESVIAVAMSRVYFAVLVGARSNEWKQWITFNPHLSSLRSFGIHSEIGTRRDSSHELSTDECGRPATYPSNYDVPSSFPEISETFSALISYSGCIHDSKNGTRGALCRRSML